MFMRRAALQVLLYTAHYKEEVPNCHAQPKLAQNLQNNYKNNLGDANYRAFAYF